MNEPKLFFENEEELKKYAKEWQTRLFLDDWTIKVRYKSYNDELGYHGSCESQFENKCALITIYNKLSFNEWMQKPCEEKVLIHELLHCKFLGLDNGSYEGKVVYEYQHQLLEEMAKSLLMAKYNIGFEWFIPDEN